MFSVPAPLSTAGSPGAMAPPVTVTDWEMVPVPPSVPPVTATFPVPVPEPVVLLTSSVPLPDTVVLLVVPGDAGAVRVIIIESDSAARDRDEAWDEAATAVDDRVVDNCREFAPAVNVSV